MTFAARLSTLTEDLVEALTNVNSDNDAPRSKRLRDAALKAFKSSPYLRTNQFDVTNNLNGLEERFRVCHRDGLADAFRQRLDALQASPSKWHPEILSLLLELSDQPTYKTKLSDLYDLCPPSSVAPEALRWEDIAREDGWNDDPALWKTMRYRGDTSDDDITYASSSDEAESTSPSDPSDGEAVGRTADDLVVNPTDTATLEAVREAQEWRVSNPATDAAGHARKIAVDEVLMVREILFMLQGLATTVFDDDCVPLPAFQTSHLAWETHRAVINTFSEIGRQLDILRQFIEEPQDTSHLQAFQDCVAKRLHNFDARLSEIHSSIVVPSVSHVVSLLSLKADLSGWTEPLCALSAILVRVSEEPDASAFRYLELLFDEASLAQLSGRTRLYEFLARIFVDCFIIYLRPIRLWMDEGKLLANDKIFFVYETAREITPSEIWRRRFKVRLAPNGSLHAPSFLHPAIAKIINAGKNLVILGRLGQFAAVNSHRMSYEPPLDYDTICPPGFDLAPFPDLFAATFDRWIQSKYRATSTILKDVLFEQCGMLNALGALQYLYFMSDGSASSAFCEEVFEKIDTLAPKWHDRYALTATAHEAYGHLVDSERLVVSVDDSGHSLPLESARDWVRSALPHIKIKYRLHWSIQMVLTPGSMEHYQSIFTLLLQFKRATYILHQPKVLDSYWTDHDQWEQRALYYSCRTNLLWFCTTVQSYLSTLVLAPNTLHLQKALHEAEDVDGITEVHDASLKNIIDEACLGSRLEPIRESMLDILDLAIKLERDGSEDGKMDVLQGIKAEFDKLLRFICGGLRSVARASSDAQAGKWATLAEMLQSGER